MHRAHHPRQHGAVAAAGVEHPQRRRPRMDAGQFQRHPLGDHPLLAAGVDEQQIFLPVLEKAKIATRVALLQRHLKSARRRHAARRGRRDIGLDAIERIDGDALALAQPLHQLAVIDRPPPEGRFRHVRAAAELRDVGLRIWSFFIARGGPAGGTNRWDARVGRSNCRRGRSTICPLRKWPIGRRSGGFHPARYTKSLRWPLTKDPTLQT